MVDRQVFADMEDRLGCLFYLVANYNTHCMGIIRYSNKMYIRTS